MGVLDRIRQLHDRAKELGASNLAQELREIGEGAVTQLGDIASAARERLTRGNKVTDEGLQRAADAFVAAGYGVPSGNGIWRTPTAEEAADAVALIMETVLAADDEQDGEEN